MSRNSLILIALLGLGGCVNRSAQVQAKKTQEILTDSTIPVQVGKSTIENLEDNLEVTGAISSGEQSTIGSSVTGRLVSVYVRDGDSVRVGQPIAQQETQDLYARLRQAQSQSSAAFATLQQALNDQRVGPTKSDSNVKAAQARLNQANARYLKAKNGSRSEERVQAEWTVKRTKSDMETAKIAADRANKLYAEGAVAKVDVENAENRYQNTLAAYEGALQNLSMVQTATRPEDLEAALLDVRAAEEALRSARADKSSDVVFRQRVNGARANYNSALDQVQLARKALADATIRSPFNGRVSGKPVQAGTFVAPGTPIVTIVGSQGTYFEANVPESNVARIVPGAKVSVTVDALKGANLSGTVVAINPQASGQGRLFSVRISVNESVGVKPGMFARGKINMGMRNGTVTVPAESIIRDGEVSYLFTIEGDKAKRVVVKTGLVSGQRIEVSGFPSGSDVVISGQSGLVNGAKVKVEKPKTESK